MIMLAGLIIVVRALRRPGGNRLTMARLFANGQADQGPHRCAVRRQQRDHAANLPSPE